jgi:membrane-associated phospholipid phosphatase
MTATADCHAILNWDPSILVWIADHLRQPWLTPIMKGITLLGSGYVLIVIACGIYLWNKRLGRYLIYVFVASVIVNYSLKHLLMTCRPPTELWIAAAKGYSFPSGHSQNATVIWLGLAFYLKKWPLGIACVLITLLVGFSRLYLGVHYPMDVIGGYTLGLVLIFLFYGFFTKQ